MSNQSQNISTMVTPCYFKEPVHVTVDGRLYLYVFFEMDTHSTVTVQERGVGVCFQNVKVIKIEKVTGDPLELDFLICANVFVQTNGKCSFGRVNVREGSVTVHNNVEDASFTDGVVCIGKSKHVSITDGSVTSSERIIPLTRANYYSTYQQAYNEGQIPTLILSNVKISGLLQITQGFLDHSGSIVSLKCSGYSYLRVAGTCSTFSGDNCNVNITQKNVGSVYCENGSIDISGNCYGCVATVTGKIKVNGYCKTAIVDSGFLEINGGCGSEPGTFEIKRCSTLDIYCGNGHCNLTDRSTRDGEIKMLRGRNVKAMWEAFLSESPVEEF